MLELDLETKIFNRLDLQKSDRDKELKDICIRDFIHCIDIYKHDLYIFEDGTSTKILKSRFTQNGVLIDIRELKKMNIFTIINRKLIEFFYSSY